MELIKPIVYRKYEKLADLNYALNNAICQYVASLHPPTAHQVSPEFRQTEQQDLEICQHFPGVNVLYDGKSAQNFIDMELFGKSGVTWYSRTTFIRHTGIVGRVCALHVS